MSYVYAKKNIEHSKIFSWNKMEVKYFETFNAQAFNAF